MRDSVCFLLSSTCGFVLLVIFVNSVDINYYSGDVEGYYVDFSTEE